MNLIYKQIEYTSTDYKQMIELRIDVLRKPLGLTYTADDLAKDEFDFLLAAFSENKIIACCILHQVNKNTFKLRQMAVANHLQKNGVGKGLIQFAEQFALQKNVNKIEMNARKYAVEFYEKLGYKIIGDEFLEVGIPHFKMEKCLIDK
jgi:predicted GNAT family N-acyltransferase